ncbi:LamG-like jellyroll fold domain-containing protein [Streptomyces sp. NPDC008121]|uniref:LamG-like jellyroll fold domain-containing protein n=1 Tax=Streptomyces sp. NPDC008121 TaxID=3364809 RepID=UPI0036E2FB4F
MATSRSRPGRRGVALLAGLVSVVSLLGVGAGAPDAVASGTELSGAQRLGTQQVLFRSGTAGYGCFRIPTLVRTRKDTLLAFAEARTSPTCADRGPIDIVVRRSTNDGRTWSPIRVVLSGDEKDPYAPHVRGNGSPVVDHETGHVFLFSNSESHIPKTGEYRRSWVQRSTDDGLSFETPQPAPRLLSGGRGWFGTGPSAGIQLRGGPHPGRLVVGAYETSADGKEQRIGLLYSDDGGGSWQASATQNSLRKDAAGNPTAKPGEPVVAELPGGRVYVSARTPYGDVRRMHAITPAGGSSVPALDFTAGWQGADVQVSVLAPAKTYEQDPGDFLLMSAPSDANGRRQEMRLQYARLRDPAHPVPSWQNVAGGLVSAKPEDRASYSSMAELSSGEIGLVYEGGTVFSAQYIYFNRFAPDDRNVPAAARLNLPAEVRTRGTALPHPSPAPGRTTPDASPEANDGYLSASAALADGASFGTTPADTVDFGQGLRLDGATGHAELPYSRSLTPGAGDVTYSLFFRYDATAATEQQALLWAYGVGANTPQVWVRAQPGENRIMARVEGVNGHVTAVVPGPHAARPAFGDGAWHHLTLTRRLPTPTQPKETVTLQVDDRVVTKAYEPAVGGAPTLGALAEEPLDHPLGVRLGDKPPVDPVTDLNDGFTGTIDEFRMYRTALEQPEREALRGPGAAGVAEDALGAHLAFQVVDTADPVELSGRRVQDDVAGHCADATILGTADLETEAPARNPRIGKGALAFSSTLPGMEVPYVPAVDNGAGDFTFTVWFRYAATRSTKDAALIWAYGHTSGKPTVWVRAKPATDRLTARVETPQGSVALDVVDTQAAGESDRAAFGDGQWHLLTLTRQNDRLTLGVDGIDPAAPQARLTTKDGPAGAFTAGNPSPGGLRIGSKPDGTDVLTGALDDFRFYKRAQGAAEVETIRKTSPGGWSPPNDPSVWWSMEPGNTENHLVMRAAADAATPATPDASDHCGHAYVRGGAAFDATGGKFGGGIRFDGVDDAVELPYGAGKALGARDFTLATWVRYRAEENTTPVLAWAYGYGTAERQLWIRAVPRENKVVAHVQTDTATTTLEVRAPAGTVFGDDTWRHVVLRRLNGELTLSVDGVRPPGKAVTGSVTYGDAFAVRGLQLGARPDGGAVDRFTGSMDEFLLVRRGVSDDELDAMRGEGHVPAAGPATVVRLPFDQVTPGGSYARM